MDQVFHNKIAQICIDHYNTLPKTGKPNKQEWTVLSCIVKENITQNHFEVVALGTGSKCIGKNSMSIKGDILNDSHAEIICRRAFLKYIYEQINCNSDNIFTSNFILQNTSFHFFTSHIPCGEAAASTEELGDLVLEEPACKRTKLEVQGTGAKLLTESSLVRTKPGRGDPTLSVSCSDKIAKWSFLGVQGALLMLILKEPIYLSTFTVVGNVSINMDSLLQALYRGITTSIDSQLYGQHNMIVGQASTTFTFHKTDDKQPCPSSIIWSKTKLSLEVAVEGKKQGVTNKNKEKRTGRLQICKIELFRIFMKTIKEIDLPLFSVIKELNYFEAKWKAKEYQDMWKFLKNNVFKVWSVKDNALLQFYVD